MKKGTSFLLLGTLSAVFFAALSLFLFPGYSVESEDQVLYIAPLLQHANPSFLTHDFLMQSTQSTASFFDEVFGFFLFGNVENIPKILFVGAFVSRVFFLLGIVLLAFSFFQNPFFALGIPVIFLIGHTKGVCNALPASSWMTSFATELHARSFAVGLLTLSLGLFFFGKKIPAFLFAIFGFLSNPIPALPLFAFFGGASLGEYRKTMSKKIQKHYRLLLLLGVFVIGLLCFMAIRSGMNLFAVVDSEWMAILQDRVPWIFVTHFLSAENGIHIFLPDIFLMAIVLGSPFFSSSLRQKVGIFTGIVVLLIALGLLFFDGFHWALFGQLQFYRVFFFLHILLVTAVMAHCVALFFHSQRNGEKLFALLAFLVVPLGSSHFPLPFTFFVLFGLVFPLFRQKQERLLIVMTTIFAIAVSFFSGETATVFQRLALFVRGDDLMLSLGLAVVWAQKILPLLFLFLVFAIFGKTKKSFDRFLLPIAGSFSLGIVLIFVIFSSDAQRILHQKWADTSDSATQWIQKNTKTDALFFASKSSENFCVFLRNHHGRNCFVSYREGGQVTFSRAAAMEWRDRRRFQSDPERYQVELRARGVDFLIFQKDEKYDGTVLFENEKWKIVSLKNEEH